MTTFALMAGMMPVAIGVGEGGEFYRPMAVAIIGGTIVSTLLTLLVVPSFYDSIEISRERAGAKFHARAELGNPFLAFVVTLVEAVLTITVRTRDLSGPHPAAAHSAPRASGEPRRAARGNGRARRLRSDRRAAEIDALETDQGELMTVPRARARGSFSVR